MVVADKLDTLEHAEMMEVVEVGSHDAPWQTGHQFQALEVIVLEASDAEFEAANETSRNLT